ncbi:hypothetical protein VD0004_g8872 [Verticillium dahliae]|nr:hypothetical protein VD0004_g8872 [Verticillium dahliae]PNH59653.1 hypothetical protein VD0001_g9917 [Verticillium dahliae]
MDFSHQYYANAQSYPFIGIPPLTPSHSNSAASDDFNTTSPPDAYPEFPPDQHQHQHQQQHHQQHHQQHQQQPHFSSFDHYQAQFLHQQAQAAANPAAQVPFPGPPTPPNNPTVRQQQQQQHRQEPPSQAAVGNGVHAQPIQPHPDAAAAAAAQKQEALDDHNRRGGSNSDDDDMTPAQSRRKAQNRAAQRAFRERKERHVKDLEAKLANLEAEAQQTTSENERLKREMQKIATENEILRATSSLNNGLPHGSLSPEPRTTGPLEYNPTDFYSDLLAKHNNKTPSHRVAIAEDGERLLAAGATWDLIINHELFKRGLVDVGDVSERLKNHAKCDGQGPVFAERTILTAIEASVASGSDELL